MFGDGLGRRRFGDLACEAVYLISEGVLNPDFNIVLIDFHVQKFVKPSSSRFYDREVLISDRLPFLRTPLHTHYVYSLTFNQQDDK
jgi:hypothetical protein